MTRGHSERSEAESKDPAAKPMSNASGSLDFARDDVVTMQSCQHFFEFFCQLRCLVSKRALA